MEIEQATTQEVFEPTIEDMIQTESGIPTTTSLVIAQVFDKEHKNVLRDIQNLECSPQFRQPNFELYEYSKDLDIGVRKYPAYRLTRDGFVFLAMGFTGKKAAAWKERFLEAFNTMEAALLNNSAREKPHVSDNASGKGRPQRTGTAAPGHGKPEFFRSARKAHQGPDESLLGVLNMECLLQNRQPEDALKELLTFFHLSSLEDMRQSDYRHAVFSVMKRMLLTSGKTSENTQVSPQYAAAIDGLLNFWNHSSDFTKSDIQNYVQNKCGLSLQEGISSDSDGLKVLFTLWGGISHYDLRLN
ncbi:MAG: Rha family transcriptional regulator [Bilophila wadsworthia]